MVELIAFIVAVLGVLFGIAGYRRALQWQRDCQQCRIIIARKGKPILDANLVEWLAWNKALPKREQSRGGVIFHGNGIAVALARPKLGAGGTTVEKKKTRVVSDAAAPAANRQARRQAIRAAASASRAAGSSSPAEDSAA